MVQFRYALILVLGVVALLYSCGANRLPHKIANEQLLSPWSHSVKAGLRRASSDNMIYGHVSSYIDMYFDDNNLRKAVLDSFVFAENGQIPESFRVIEHLNDKGKVPFYNVVFVFEDTDTAYCIESTLRLDGVEENMVTIESMQRTFQPTEHLRFIIDFDSMEEGISLNGDAETPNFSMTTAHSSISMHAITKFKIVEDSLRATSKVFIDLSSF